MNKDIFVLVFQAYVIRGVTDTVHLILLYSTKTCVCILIFFTPAIFFFDFRYLERFWREIFQKLRFRFSTKFSENFFFCDSIFMIYNATRLITLSNTIMPFDTNITGFWYIIHFFSHLEIYSWRDLLAGFHR